MKRKIKNDVIDYWFFGLQGRETFTMLRTMERIIGRSFSSSEALKITEQILKQSIQEQAEFEEWEARKII